MLNSRITIRASLAPCYILHKTLAYVRDIDGLTLYFDFQCFTSPSLVRDENNALGHCEKAPSSFGLVIFAQNLFSSPTRGGEVKHWKSKYNVWPSISLTYARVLRRIFRALEPARSRNSLDNRRRGLLAVKRPSVLNSCFHLYHLRLQALVGARTCVVQDT